MCKTQYTHVQKCLPIMNMSVFNIDTDSGITYMPCGHTNVLSVDDEDDTVKECGVCKSEIIEKMKVFMS